MRMAHGFDSTAQYQVSTWRGIEYGGRDFKDGDVVTVADIPATTLYTFYRFHMVAPVAALADAAPPAGAAPPATPSTSPSVRDTRAVAASTAVHASTVASSGISVEPQPRHEAGVNTLPRPSRDRKWLASANTEELRQECEVRGLDTRGDKSQLRGRLFPLVD